MCWVECCGARASVSWSFSAMGAGQSSQVVLDGDGGCYSVKCRSEPLMVHDRAVLRVTKEVRLRPRSVATGPRRPGPPVPRLCPTLEGICLV